MCVCLDALLMISLMDDAVVVNPNPGGCSLVVIGGVTASSKER